jgi:hypothetical protein
MTILDSSVNLLFDAFLEVVEHGGSQTGAGDGGNFGFLAVGHTLPDGSRWLEVCGSQG